MKISVITSVLILLLTLSCNQKKKKEALNTESKLLELTVIEGYPDDYVGCGCAFAKNEADFKNQKFIYFEKYGSTDDLQNFKLLAINGKILRWNDNDAPKDFTLLAEKTGRTGADPESKTTLGELTLKFNNGATIKTELFGTCGC